MNYANCMWLFHKYSLIHTLVKHQLHAILLHEVLGKTRVSHRGLRVQEGRNLQTKPFHFHVTAEGKAGRAWTGQRKREQTTHPQDAP